MSQMIQDKATMLGISNADQLTDEQLEMEVMYASLNPMGRYNYEGRHGVPDIYIRTTLPDPVYIPGYGRVA